MYSAHLQDLQIRNSLLHELLYSPWVDLGDMLAEGIAGAPMRIFPEVVSCELTSLAQKAAELDEITLTWCPDQHS